jgi:hydrogenase maturation protease
MSREEGTVSKEQRILVLGVGNEILMDDGIGPRLVNDLKELTTYDLRLTTNIKFENLFIGGLGLLEYIQDYDIVIILDAIKTLNGVPGDVYYYTPDDFKETLHLSSFHDASFLTALKFGDKLGFNIPKKIHIIAVEIIEDRTFGKDFTQPLQDRYDEILNEVIQKIQSLIVN